MLGGTEKHTKKTTTSASRERKNKPLRHDATQTLGQPCQQTIVNLMQLSAGLTGSLVTFKRAQLVRLGHVNTVVGRKLYLFQLTDNND